MSITVFSLNLETGDYSEMTVFLLKLSLKQNQDEYLSSFKCFSCLHKFLEFRVNLSFSQPVQADASLNTHIWDEEYKHQVERNAIYRVSLMSRYILHIFRETFQKKESCGVCTQGQLVSTTVVGKKKKITLYDYRNKNTSKPIQKPGLYHSDRQFFFFFAI